MESIVHARRHAAAILVLALSVATGCAKPSGSWQTKEITPQGSAFPINQLTFGENGKYTATGLFSAQGKHDGKVHTTTGAYKFTGQKLSLSPTGGPTLDYRVRRRADGKLVMTYRQPGQEREVTAVLEQAR